MKRFLTLLALGLSAAWFTGCVNAPLSRSSSYRITAYKPTNPDAVRVKVSTGTQTVYVMEGDRCLMAAQCCVGKPGAATPHGSFTIYNKIRNKRSGSYGFTSSGAPADRNRGDNVAIGYPMQYWCEFSPAYGFHSGYLWSIPHTHGCIRLHKEAAARFFALVKTGTPVNISTSQPEDSRFAGKVLRIDQRNDPDPPKSLLMSEGIFTEPAGPLLIDGPGV